LNTKDPFEGLESEFGCIEPIRWADASMVKVTDSNGKELMCSKCDKPAVTSIIGVDASVSYCSEHAGYND